MINPRPENVLAGSDGSHGHDGSDIQIRGVFLFLVGFVLMMVGLLLLVWHIQGRVQGTEQPHAIAQPMVLSQPLQPSAGHPALPWQDMAAMRASQEAWLKSAGPLPNDVAHRHIPIGQAMDALLQSGALTQPWVNPASQPYVRPPDEKPASPSVENRT